MNSVDEGIVTAVRANQIVVEDEHGFIIEVSEHEIILQKTDIDALHHAYDFGIEHKREADVRNLRKSSDFNTTSKQRSAGRKDILEVDLHINELVDKTRHLTNFQMVTIQMNHFRKMMSLAFENKYPKIVFIHGVGEGVLRSEIRSELREMPNCEYVDADFSKYGQGATEVNLWYN